MSANVDECVHFFNGQILKCIDCFILTWNIQQGDVHINRYYCECARVGQMTIFIAVAGEFSHNLD